jgi:hypothetical protein
VRKAAALGAGAATVGMTLAGAFAYDLSTYPQNKFIVDGRFDGEIVIGQNAATSDVIGAIDIAASLQGASVTEVPLPGTAGEVSLSGENFKLSSGADEVELREPIGEVVDTVTESDLPGLKSGRITTSEGDTEYFQYLRFKDGSNLQNMTVNYVENDDDVMADYLVVDTDSPFLEWEIQFPEGLESEIDDNDKLEDIEDRSFNILGTDFTIVSAELTNGDDIEMTLMGGSIADTLREGETRTYSIDGVDYEVTLVFVSDPNEGTAEAKFSVNGELTQALEEGDTDTLSGGLQIGVRDVLVNSREGVASFFLGADKVVMTDTTSTVADDFSGDIEINNENINDGDVTILGQNVSGVTGFEFTSIKYRLTMDAADGTTAFIPEGQGVREFMKRPESLISESLDVKYEGLTEPERTEIQIAPKGDDEYEMTFTNIQGQEYTFPLLSNKNGVFKFGEEDDDLVFVEAADQATHNIGREDYFIVSNDRGTGDADKSVTNVLRYEDYDTTDRTLELQNVASGATVNVPIDSSGIGSLVIGGHTYAVNVSDPTVDEPTINVDLNADDGFGDVVTITTWGGVIVDLLETAVVNSSLNLTSGTAVGTLALYIGNGVDLESATGDPSDQSVIMNAKVLSKNFDSSDNDVDEEFNWTISEVASGNEVDLSVSEAQYRGPLAGSVTDVTDFQFNELENDDEKNVGMTDYGVLITEEDPDGSSEPNTLTLSVPKSQVFGQVFVTLGTTETIAGGGSGTSAIVNPIAVGLAVLDTDAGALGSENQIIVGGPCANTAAAAFMGNPENCAEGFEPGKAMIVAKEYGSNVAILVAGYEAMETQGASRVLAAYKDYSLSGTEAEVVVASLSDITVSAAGGSMS